MLYIDDVSFPGHGTITGAFWSRDRRILAVTSIFRRLTEPPARAAYGGHKLRFRVSLYQPPARQPIAVFDDAVIPINDVSFHPASTVVAIGAGSYDGGYLFQGQLVLWDWTSSAARSVRAIPEVTRLRFTDAGDDIEAIVRPWDDGAGDSPIGDPYDAFYRLTLSANCSENWDGLTEQAIRDQMIGQTPLKDRDVTNISSFGRLIEDPLAVIGGAFGLGKFKHRSPIWDVALTVSDAISIVHDDCVLEVYDRQGERRLSFKDGGHGVQIFRARELLVHCTHINKNARDRWNDCNTRLMRLHDGRLDEVVSLKGRYSFSMAQSGNLLGRCDRSFQTKRESAAVDLILSADLTTFTQHDLGHYDVFNHFIRADGAPYLFFVQGTPPSSHQGQYLCTVTDNGHVERLWPLLADAGDTRSHAMECCFCYIQDDQGPGMIVSGRHYNPSPRAPYDGFIYRRNLDGRELWRHGTAASAASIKVVPNAGLVLAAFLDGDFAMLRGDSGAIAHWQQFRPDGYPSIIVSLDVDDTHIAIGTIDGRCAVSALRSFIIEPFS